MSATVPACFGKGPILFINVFLLYITSLKTRTYKFKMGQIIFDRRNIFCYTVLFVA